MKDAPRFYCPLALAPGARIALPEEASHHLARVLRAQAGDALRLFDGAGGEWSAQILAIDKRGVAALVGEHRALERESPLLITLAQGIAAADKMDWIIQKATELGVHAIQPIVTSRVVIRLDEDRAQKRLRHWQHVAIAACEQCGRNRVPQVAAPLPLERWLARPAPGLRLMLAPRAETPLPALALPQMAVELLIGPEGGLSEAEAALAQHAGAQALRLGPRVLRTETAGLAALAAMQAMWGDWR